MDILELLRVLKESALDTAQILEVSNGLDSIGNVNTIYGSRRAWADLRNHGENMSMDLAYGYQTASKIKQLIMNEEDTKYERLIISDTLMDKAKKTKDYQLRVKADDYKHLYYLTYDEKDIEYIPSVKHLTKVTLANNMEPYSDAWMLYVVLGPVDNVGGALKSAIANVKGMYQSFKSDDPTFQAGYKLFKDPRKRALLPTFFKMINASPKESLLYTAQFRHYASTHALTYEYVITPRMLFYISDNPMSALKNTRYHEMHGHPSSNEAVALLATYTYLLLTSSPQIINGKKFVLSVHERILNEAKTTFAVKTL